MISAVSCDRPRDRERKRIEAASGVISSSFSVRRILLNRHFLVASGDFQQVFPEILRQKTLFGFIFLLDEFGGEGSVVFLKDSVVLIV